ncbi:E3 ubiquitin-protein ligase RNF146-like [Delphinapterus leucas]|uniref:E3 ubiquitin-protein ligase n=1 Tax=Delphinapterus leucas TaxID=9749 RepID=A0A7F8KES4_DELLE|nr:E3 ubiquitin-protein ligase RNF146-like [Delphinapterus leucas]
MRSKFAIVSNLAYSISLLIVLEVTVENHSASKYHGGGPAPRDATGGHVTAARASPAAAGPEAEEKRLRGDRGCGHRGRCFIFVTDICGICSRNTCVHPVSLPCKHVFCYLCVKGASWLGKRCALCRQEIPEDFLDKPTLLSPEELKAASRGNGEYAWYYEGRNGWWQYDERTSRELEDAFSKGKKSTEMLIAGFLYVADLENMVQYRRNEHGRRRKIKRDIIDIPKKGVAGLRLDCDANTVNLARESSADGADSVSAQSGASVQPLVSSSVRPLTSVDGQLTSPATPSPDASTSLEDSFAHLQLGGDSIAERSHRGEGEEDHESPSSGRVPAPDTSIEETESDASSDSEDGSALLAQHSLTQQRLLVPNPNQTVSDRSDLSGTDRSVAGGGTVGVSVRSRRPDGQCTVTEV